MKPATEYRLEWDTMPVQIEAGEVIPSQTIRVSIFDNEDLIPDDQITNVINLKPTGDPLTISIINNDEDKYSPIRGKQAVIRFLSDSSLFQEMATFSDSSDNRWYVEIKDITNTLTIFLGFLMLPDMQQLFQPDPVTVELTASDHLGLLRDIPLTDFNEDTPMGKYTFAALISYCLRKTGLSLYWTAINNLRHGSGERIATNVNFNATGNVITVDFFIGFFYVGMPLQIDSASNDMTTTVTEIISSTQIRVADTLVNETATIYNVTFTDLSSADHFYLLYLDTKTFEDEIGTCINCYEVLEKILGEDCFLTQYRGKWWIVRIDEYDSNLMYPAEFDPDGTFIEFGAAIDLSISIGDADTIRFCNADQLLRSNRPHKSIKETFKFEVPLEIPCNVDYSRGDATADPDVQRTGYTSYELDCWTKQRLWGADATTVLWKSAILKKFNNLGDELERFIMLTMPASATGAFEFIKSSPIPLGFMDRFTFSFDAAAMQDPNGDGVLLVCMILLYGSDGSVYVLRASDTGIVWTNDAGETDTVWRLTDEEVTLFRSGLWWSIYDDADNPNKMEWASFVMSSAPLPVDGDVVIHLFSANQFAGTFDDFDIKYQNLQFEYRHYIGGSYKRYTGQYNKVTRSEPDYNAIRDNEVFISDSPKALFKGTMFVLIDGIYVRSSQFYVAIPGDSRPPNRYGYLQAFSVWNQYRTGFRILSGSVLGLGDNPPDIVHKYTLSDSNLNTEGKLFILISYNQNWKTGIWTGVFLEVFDINNPKNYGDDHEFKFITK